MLNWTSTNFSNLARILRCFHASSGLKVNFHKSKVFGIGVSKSEDAKCARILGCEAAASWAKKSLPGTWSSIANFIPLLSKLNIELSHIFEFQVGDGDHTLFWLDDWIGNEALASNYPPLCSLDRRKNLIYS